jgi:hypothetical protein
MDPRLTSMTANNLPVNRQQPVFQGNPSIHSQVIASRVLEPVYVHKFIFLANTWQNKWSNYYKCLIDYSACN